MASITADRGFIVGEATRIFTADDSWWGKDGPDYLSKVVCPVCGIDYCHLSDLQSAPCGPGTRIVVAFWCEAQHRFNLILQFHKGQTFSAVRRASDYPEDEAPAEMWRD